MSNLLKKILILLPALYCVIFYQTAIAEEAIKVKCKGGAILVEYRTSNVIFEQEADKQWPPASITKVMTSVIALEQGNLNDDVRFSADAVKQERSNLGIKEGVRVPLYRLIEAMLVKSGNDAAFAVAEHIAGSEAEFAKLMNKKAKSLGMYNTNFTNASGLPDDEQYSTARDLSVLCIYAMGLPEFKRIVAQRELQFINEDATQDLTIYSTNKLIGVHPLVDGIKTGFTNKSRRCLATSATFRNYCLISVVLGAEDPEVWLESAKLLDHGFQRHDPLYPLYREFELEIPLDEEDTDTGG